MNSLLFRLKDKLYYYMVDKNWGVGPEYHRYVETHQEEHINNRWKSWWLLLRLNWHYRILRKKYPLIKIIDNKSNKSNKSKIKLPYLGGAESEAFKRREAIYFAKDLLQFDVISFDIFDTLVLRPFAKPVDLFMIVGKRLDKIEFTRIRIDAEKRAREIAMQKNGNTEITIADIYKIIEERTGIPKEKGIQTEFETELDYCFANPYMKRVYRLLKEQNKKIIIVSDMYIPHDMMAKLLLKCGFDNYEKLYVSCDYKCTKRNGNLYKYVLEDFKGNNIVHVGDNRISDVKSAKEAGIEIRYYKNCHEIGNQFRADGMSPLIGSAYAGIVNTHLHNGIKTYSPYYEYGFIYGGLYILGFCNWMHKKAKSENIDKILFLSRDGYIYQKVFNILFDDVKNEYFLWSRIANIKYLARKNREDFIKRSINNRAKETLKVTIGSLLSSLSLTEFKDILMKYNLKEDDLIVTQNVDIIEKMFIENWEMVCSLIEEEKRFIQKYIEAKVYKVQKVAFVDVGWVGSCVMGLKYLVEKDLLLNCKVSCWQAASKSQLDLDITTELLDNTIEPYIFSGLFNKNLLSIHSKTNRGLNSIFFEIFTQAPYPSYKGISIDSKLNFDIPEVENYKIILEIQDGISNFVKCYKNTFKNDNYMMNIPGSDAYLSFYMIAKNPKWLKQYLKNIVYARGLSGDVDHQRIENLGEIILYNKL